MTRNQLPDCNRKSIKVDDFSRHLPPPSHLDYPPSDRARSGRGGRSDWIRLPHRSRNRLYDVPPRALPEQSPDTSRTVHAPPGRAAAKPPLQSHGIQAKKEAALTNGPKSREETPGTGGREPAAHDHQYVGDSRRATTEPDSKKSMQLVLILVQSACVPKESRFGCRAVTNRDARLVHWGAHGRYAACRGSKCERGRRPGTTSNGPQSEPFGPSSKNDVRHRPR